MSVNSDCVLCAGSKGSGDRLSDEEGVDGVGYIDDEDERVRTSTIASLLEERLKKEKLRILSDKSLVAAVQEFVDKSEKDAIAE